MRAIILGLVAVLVSVPVGATSNEVRFTSWGGAYQDAQVENWNKPFTNETGIQVRMDSYNGEMGLLQSQVRANSIKWDVLDMTKASAEQACQEGLLEPLEFDRTKFLDGTYGDCYVGVIQYGTVLASKHQNMTLEKFFDPDVKFKRALKKEAVNNLEWALLAAGIEPDQVYERLNTPSGLALAFAYLDLIKDQIVWYDSGSQAVDLLASGEADVAAVYTGRMFDANKNGLGLRKVFGSLIGDIGVIGIVKGTPNLENAKKYVSYVTSREMASILSWVLPYASTRVDDTDLVNPEVSVNYTPDMLTDSEFWTDHQEELNQRFQVWMAH